MKKQNILNKLTLSLLTTSTITMGTLVLNSNTNFFSSNSKSNNLIKTETNPVPETKEIFGIKARKTDSLFKYPFLTEYWLVYANVDDEGYFAMGKPAVIEFQKLNPDKPITHWTVDGIPTNKDGVEMKDNQIKIDNPERFEGKQITCWSKNESGGTGLQIVIKTRDFSDPQLSATIESVSIVGDGTLDENDYITLNASVKMSDPSILVPSDVQYQWWFKDESKYEEINSQNNSKFWMYKDNESIKYNGRQVVVRATYKGKMVESPEPVTLDFGDKYIKQLNIDNIGTLLTDGDKITVNSNFVPSSGNISDFPVDKIRYQWYLKDGSTLKEISGQTKSTLDLQVDTSMNNKQLVLKASCNGIETTSNAIDLMVKPTAAPTPSPGPAPSSQEVTSISINGNSQKTYYYGDSILLSTDIVMSDKGQVPADGLTYKWYKTSGSKEELIPDKTDKFISLVASKELAGKSIIAEVTYKSKKVKSAPFTLKVVEKPSVEPPKPNKPTVPSYGENNTPNAPSSGGTNSTKPSNPSKPNAPTNSNLGNNGLVENSGLDWWVYAAIVGCSIVLIAGIATTVLLLKKKKSKRNKKVKTQQVVRINGSNVKTITTSRTFPTKATSRLMPSFRNPPPSNKKR